MSPDGLPFGLSVAGSRGAPAAVDAVVFDYDDTLASSLPARIDAMKRTFDAVGFTGMSAEEFIGSHRGIPLQVALDGFDGGRGVELEMTRIYRRAYWHKEPGLVPLFEGVRDLLDGLLEAGVPMGIITSMARDIVVDGRAGGAIVEFAEQGIERHFLHVVGVEDVTHPKPHPEGLNRVLEHIGVDPASTLMVGDSPADIQAGHNAGCWSCLAGWGVPHEERDLAAATPDLIAEDPVALLRALVG